MHCIDLGEALFTSHFSLFTYICHRLPPVKHRREFQHDTICLFQHFIEDFQYIGGAVGYAVSPASMDIATGRVEINQVCMIQPVQIVGTVATDHLDMPKTQTFVILR